VHGIVQAHSRRERLLAVSLALCALVATAGGAFAQTPAGSWRLLKTEHRGFAGEVPTIGGYDLQVGGESSNGSLLARFVRNPNEESRSVATATATWSAPPQEVAPGDVWSLGGRMTGEGTTGSVGAVMVFSAVPADDGNASTRGTGWRDGQPWPGPSDPGHPYLVVSVNARLKHSVVLPGIAGIPSRRSGEAWDTWWYVYEWSAPRGPEAASLRILVRSSQGGAVGGATARVKSLDTGEEQQLPTSADGVAKGRFRVPAGSRRVRLRVVDVALTSATHYAIPLEGTVPSFLAGTTRLVAPINQDVALDESNAFSGTLECQVPLARLNVLALRWDDPSAAWVAASPIVRIRRQRAQTPLLEAPATAFRPGAAGTSVLSVYLPPRPILDAERVEVLGYLQSVRQRDLQLLLVPRADGEVQRVTLMLSDEALKIARLRQRLFEYLRGMVGEEAARRVSSLPIRLDPTLAVPRYVDGEMQLPGTVDLTADEFCETLMHEWGHHIAGVLDPDPGIEGRLGGAHDPWTPAATRELAWDEGRANFFGAVLTRGLGLPHNPDGFGADESRAFARAPGHGADRVESVATSALLDYYRATGFRQTSAVLQDFLATHDACRAGRNHPPRTASEFFEVKRQMVEGQVQSGQIRPDEGRRILGQIDRVVADHAVGQ